MCDVEGSAVSVFKDAVGKCLFKVGLTMSSGLSSWAGANPPFDQTRRDLIHALLGASSLSFFREPGATYSLDWSGFPFADFLKSLCRIASDYLSSPNPLLCDLVRNCSAFAARLFTVPEFRSMVGRLRSQFLLSALSRGPKGPVLFQATGPLLNEAVSILYMTSLFQPDFVHFVASSGYSNNFVFRLAEAAAVQYERFGINYLHSLLLSTILLFVADDTVAVSLNEQWSGVFAAVFVPPPGSHADLLMMVILNVCQQEAFWPSAICIFHTVAPHIHAFSLAVASRVMKLFQLCVARHRHLALLVVEGSSGLSRTPQTETTDSSKRSST
jgi:hypothetical protein